MAATHHYELGPNASAQIDSPAQPLASHSSVRRSQASVRLSGLASVDSVSDGERDQTSVRRRLEVVSAQRSCRTIREEFSEICLTFVFFAIAIQQSVEERRTVRLSEAAAAGS